MSEPVTPPSKSVILPNLSLSPSSTSLHYYCHIGSDISNELLKECVTLFGDSYGIWGQNPISTEGPKPGASDITAFFQLQNNRTNNYMQVRGSRCLVQGSASNALWYPNGPFLLRAT